jgi:GT2 family glycosyltransferase
VIICAYDNGRVSLIRRAVTEVLRQLSDDDELILVIDHNEPLRVALGDQYCSAGVAVIANQEHRGLSGARNSGAAVASGEVVVFLDDDAVPLRGWLDEIISSFGNGGIAAVGGRVDAEWVAGRPTWFPPEFDWVVGCSYAGQQVGDVRNPIGANMAVRRSALRDAGGFRHGLGRVGKTPLGCEETELGIRIAAKGLGRCVVVADSAVSHHVPQERGSLRYFSRRCWSEGLSKALVRKWASDAETPAPEALGAERSHLALLARSVADSFGSAARERSVIPLAQGAAITLGTSLTVAGFVRGSLSRAAT